MSNKSKNSKMKKAMVTFTSFNAHEIETFDITFEKIRLAACNALYREGLPYNQWCTIERMKNTLRRAWDYDGADQDVEFYFRRWWLSHIVKEFGVQIWNEVNHKHHHNWFKTKFLPKTDLPKKLRSNPEAVSSHLADKAENEFYALFY